ncbi:hypothetical protein KY361_04750 [Candidatus Woesearchaeota archaeon]|nr:hypothetical protein [Candidatus Woesearchaeota archaeon]
MVIAFDKTLADALREIGFSESEGVHLEEVVYDGEVHLSELSPEEQESLFARIGRAYGEVFNQVTLCGKSWDVPHLRNLSDFISHITTNVRKYSQYGIEYRIHFWQGERGFVVGIEQKGRGFEAKRVDSERIASSYGNGFNFYRACSPYIFFDSPSDARIVYMQWSG